LNSSPLSLHDALPILTELMIAAVEWVEKYTGKYLWRRNITYKAQPQDRSNRYAVIYAAPDLAIVSVNGITADLPGLNGDRLPIRSEEHTSELQSRENL